MVIKCQFCQTSCENTDELQVHQTVLCPAIDVQILENLEEKVMDNFQALKVADLKEELKRRGLRLDGRKDQLRNRLIEAEGLAQMQTARESIESMPPMPAVPQLQSSPSSTPPSPPSLPISPLLPTTGLNALAIAAGLRGGTRVDYVALNDGIEEECLSHNSFTVTESSLGITNDEIDEDIIANQEAAKLHEASKLDEDQRVENSGHVDIDHDMLVNAVSTIMVDMEKLKTKFTKWIQYFNQHLERITKSLDNRDPVLPKKHTQSPFHQQEGQTGEWTVAGKRRVDRPQKQNQTSSYKGTPIRNQFQALAFINNGPPEINRDDDAISGVEKGIAPSHSSSLQEAISTQQVKRPPVVVQKNPESNIILSHRSYDRDIRTVPGNSSYNRMVQHGKQIGIFGDSMVKRVLGNKISKDIKCGTAKVRPFLGATASEVSYHTKSELKKCDFDIAVICAGTNNIPLEQTPDEIVQEIINAGYMCKDYGVNDIVVSLLTARRGYENKVTQVNNLLVDYCRAAHFYFVDHSNITLDHLYDGLHIDSKYLYLYANNISQQINAI